MYTEQTQIARDHRILGLDPGSRVVGFALLGAKGALPRPISHFHVFDFGVLKSDVSLSFQNRIGQLHLALCHLIETLKPTVCAMEKSFLGPNVQSALKLGESRGALISAFVRYGVPIFEVAPTAVKNHMTGNGHASKEQVALVLQRILKIQKGQLPYDATDAVAIALTYGSGFIEKSAKGKNL